MRAFRSAVLVFICDWCFKPFGEEQVAPSLDGTEHICFACAQKDENRERIPPTRAKAIAK